MLLSDSLHLGDLIGVPFLDGGRDPARGLDCWGLVLEVYRRLGLSLPDFTVSAFDFPAVDAAISTECKRWKRHEWPTVPVPAVLVIRFGVVEFCNHCGVYLAGGLFMHTRERIGVNIDRVESPAWNRKIAGFYSYE